MKDTDLKMTHYTLGARSVVNEFKGTGTQKITANNTKIKNNRDEYYRYTVLINTAKWLSIQRSSVFNHTLKLSQTGSFKTQSLSELKRKANSSEPKDCVSSPTLSFSQRHSGHLLIIKMLVVKTMNSNSLEIIFCPQSVTKTNQNIWVLDVVYYLLLYGHGLSKH